MKRVLLSVTVIALLAGPVSADLYTLDASTAAQLRITAFSDDASLNWVGYNDGTKTGTKVFGSSPLYGANMQLEVGFMGMLADIDGDSLASVSIGGGPGTTDTFSGFSLSLANDDDDPWSYGLYVNTTGGSYVTPDDEFVTLARDTRTVLSLGFGGDIDFDTVTELGFIIRGDFSGDSPSNPDFFHTSVVPAPVGVVLGMLGLGVAGLKLRRFV